jgi:nucleoid DNA-binding protein
MNKRDLIMAAAAQSNGSITQGNIQRGFELILKNTLKALAKGEKITIANFGTFYVKEMKEKAEIRLQEKRS